MPCPQSPGGYAAPPEVYVTVAGTNGGGSFTAVGMESYVQKMVASETSNPRSFLLNPPPAFGLASVGVAGVPAAILDTINQRCQSYPSICGFDKNAMAAKYAQVLFDALKAIPACGYDQSLVGSVYDNWGKGINANACPPGYSGTHDTGCIPLPCASGFMHAPYPDSPCVPVPAVGQSVTPGQTQQTAPAGSVPVQTTPSSYGGGTVIQTVGPGGNGGSSNVSANASQNGQTPFVAANLIPASTLGTQMQATTGYPTAVPAAWCSLMAQMLGGFTCPSLSLNATAPVDATTFLAALRAVESAQTAAPAITSGGFLNNGGAPVPAPTINASATPPPALGFTMTPVMIGVAIAVVVVVVLVAKKRA